MNNEQLHRDLGRIEGKLDSTAAQVAALEAKLDPVVAYINRHKGAMWMGSGVLSASVAAITAWLVK